MGLKINIKPSLKPSLAAKPLAGITPEAKAEPAKVTPIASPSPSPSPVIQPNSLSSLSQAVKEKVADSEPLDLDLDANPLLDNVEEAFNPMSSLEEKLRDIEALMEKQDIPVKTLKMCCDSIMKDLKHSPDTVLDLEPEQIQTIVQGYIKAADTEVTKVLVKKKKATKKAKPKISSKAKALLEAASQLDLDGVDF